MVEQPHFDDERTVLHARQVVPLTAVDDRIRHRRRWFLGGAFAVAMFLGAASALLAAYFKIRDVPDPEIQSLSVVSEPDPLPQTPTVAVIATHAKPRPKNTDQTDLTAAQTLRNDQPASQPGLSERDALRQIRDSVLVDQWEEQRARRVERRESRRSQHRNRGLSNINEIFEGPRHP
jgi:hypothetical protein